MMLIQRLLVMLVVVAAAVGAVALGRARNAAGHADRALSHLEAVREQVAAIERIRAQTPAWAERRRPSLGQGGLATAVNEVLATAGLPASALASLSPTAESLVTLGIGAQQDAGVAAFSRRAVLTISPATLPQVGVVLKTWRETHPEWTITTIDLTPEPHGRRDPPPGSDLPLRAVLGLETLYGSAATTGTGAQR